MRDEALYNAVFDSIKSLKRLCNCGKLQMKWYHFEYATDLLAFIEGQPVWSDCCPEDED